MKYLKTLTFPPEAGERKEAMEKYYMKYYPVPLNHQIKASDSLHIPIISKHNLQNKSISLMKEIIFFLFTFHTSLLPLFSQPVTQEWVRNYQGPSNDLIGPFLAVDKQGNSYIAGTHVVNDSINILCAKYNTQGAQQWAKLYKYPGEGYFAPTGLALDSTGNAYVISFFAQTYLGPYNGLIVKFNSLNGSPDWAKRYIGQNGESAFRDIKIDRLNNIYVTGVSDMSHLVIRYNTNGDSVWVKKYNPPSCGESALACTLDDSLNIIFTGLRRFYYPPYGYYDSLLAAKYSPSGVLKWESVYAYSYLGANMGTKIAADQNGSAYIGGVTTVSGLGVFLTLKYDRNGVRQWAKIFYGVPQGGDNTLYEITMDRINNAFFATGRAIINGIAVAATIKYNPSTGDSIWVKTDTGYYNRGASRSVTLDSNGNIYITGETYNFPSYVPYDILTVKYSNDGDQIWRMTYNGSFNGLDIGKDLEIDQFNNVYVLGTSQSSTQVSDYIVIKYVQFVGIKPLSKVIPQEFILKQNYPNPFNSTTIIRFSTPKKSFVQIQIYDLLGRLTDTPVNKEIEASEYELNIDASNYSSGIYFYRLIAGGSIIDTKKFIVLK